MYLTTRWCFTRTSPVALTEPFYLKAAWTTENLLSMFSRVAGDVSVVELKRSSMMQRLSGWMPTAIRGDHGAADVVLSLAVREVENGSFLFALCQDHKLRMWSITDKVILGCCCFLFFYPPGRS